MNLTRTVLYAWCPVVLLWAITVCSVPSPAHATIDWNDGFEYADDAAMRAVWNSSQPTCDYGGPTPSSDRFFSGSKSAKLIYRGHVGTDPGAGGCYIDRYFPGPGTTLYTRFMMYMENFIYDQTVGTKIILQGEDCCYPSFWWGMPNGTNSLYVAIQGVILDNGTSDAQSVVGGSIPQNQWNCIETRLTMSTPGVDDGIVQAWINGTQIMNKTNQRMRAATLNQSNSPNAQFRFVRLYTQHGRGLIYYDDVAVSRDARIGCGSTPPPPIDTQAPNPVTGFTVTTSGSTIANLSWNACVDVGPAGCGGVTIRRLLGVGTPTTTLTTVSGSATSYQDSTLATGQTATYAINFFDNASPSNATAFSSPVQVTTSGTPSVRTTVFTKDWAGTDGNDIGTDWDAGYTGTNPFQRVSGRLRVQALVTDSWESFNGMPSSVTDQWIQCTLPTLQGFTNTFPGVLTRQASAPTKSGYEFRITNSSASRIARWDNGAFTQLSSDSTVSWQPGDTFRLENEGTTLRVFRIRAGAETLVSNLTVTDSTYTSGKLGLIASAHASTADVEYGPCTGGTFGVAASDLPGVTGLTLTSTYADAVFSGSPSTVRVSGGLGFQLVPITEFATTTSRVTIGTDTFDRANENPISTAGVWACGYTGQTCFQLLGNNIRGLTVGVANQDNYMTWTSAVPNDVAVKVTLSTINGPGTLSFPGLMVRAAAPSAKSGYECRIDGATNARIARWTVGAWALLDTRAVSGAWQVGDSIWCEAMGSSISMYRERAGVKTLVAQATDSTYASGRVGIIDFVTSSNADMIYDDVGIESLSAATASRHTFTTSILNLINPLDRFLCYTARNAAGVESTDPALTQCRTVPQSAIDSGPNTGVLRPLAGNPRWLTNDSGEALYFSGVSGQCNCAGGFVVNSPSVAFRSLVDQSWQSNSITPNDFTAALNTVTGVNQLNAARFWAMETPLFGTTAQFSGGTYYRQPLDQVAFKQVGTRTDTSTGTSITVGVYDLSQWNQAFFDKVRARVVESLNAGMVPTVMLFHGFWNNTGGGITDSGFSSPFHTGNNVNGIAADVNANKFVEETHTLLTTAQGLAVTAYQVAYVKKMIDTLNDVDGFVWEISNEDHFDSSAWTTRIEDEIIAYELSGGRQTHPILRGPYNTPPNNTYLFNDTRATIITPTCIGGDNYELAPPASTGAKIVWYDDDHTHDGTVCFPNMDELVPWRLFTRAVYFFYLDTRQSAPTTAAVKVAQAQTVDWSTRVNLKAMVPDTGSIFSSTFGLHEACKEYLMYMPTEGSNTINLSACAGKTFTVEHFNPATGVTTANGTTPGGSTPSFNPAWTGPAVVHLKEAPVVDVTPPTVFNVQPSGTLPITTTQTTWSVQTSEPATCRFGATNTAYASQPFTLTADVTGTSHTFTESQTSGFTYIRTGRCIDVIGNATTTDFVVTWTIAAQTDFTAPVISNPQPQTPQPAGTSAVQISGTTNEDAECRVHTSNVAYSSMPSANAMVSVGNVHSFTVTGLSAGTFTRYMGCRDRAELVPNENTVAQNLVITFTIDAATSDTTPPTTVASVQCTPISGTQANCTWAIATDAGGVQGYNYSLCQGAGCTTFSFAGFTGSNTVQLLNLAPSTTYRMVVRALDTSNNLSAADSNIASFTMPAPVDTTRPSIMTNLRVCGTNVRSQCLQWDSMTDEPFGGAVRATIEICIVGTTCPTFSSKQTDVLDTQTILDLQPGTSYQARGIGSDEAGNISSGYSNIVSFTTKTTGLDVDRPGPSFGFDRSQSSGGGSVIRPQKP
jgi:hypothetical protein